MKQATMKKGLAVIAAAALILLAACGKSSGSKLVEDKTNVVTSFYPLYYFASKIGGDDVNVVNLVPAGVEPHDWTPKSRDIETASNAQLFLYNGAGLETWVDNFLKGLSKDSGVKASEMSTGIELLEGDGEEPHDHGAGAEETEEHGHDTHVDPHTWVSPKSALIMAENVKKELVAADEAHKDHYEANFAALKKELEALDARYEKELGATSRKDIVVSHQAFGYLARDYGLEQVAIMGLSPDAEPRGQDLMNIVDYVKDNGVRYIFFEELVSDQLAKTLAEEANVDTLVLNPLEGLTPAQEKEGKDYISIMDDNLQNLLKALK